MGLLTWIFQKLEESDSLEGFEVTQDALNRYCRKRQEIEAGEKGISQGFKLLEKNIKRKGYDTDRIYRKWLSGKAFIPKEEGEALDDAEDILEEPTKIERKTRFKIPEKGSEFTQQSETDTPTPGGGVESVTEEVIPVAVCGKTFSSLKEIPGFCIVCERAVCSDHLVHCEGYGSSGCNKALCQEHANYFEDADGTRHPCCAEHYNLRLYFEKPM